MSYHSISVKEAVEKINASNKGWFLPATQRPYVWGGRYESEKYICRLFDSILRGYPIGTLIVWETEKKISFHEFMRRYKDGERMSASPENLWESYKGLIYDGQQRLQTLYSCLKHTLNGRELVFNMLFKEDDDDLDETGFSFIDEGSPLKKGDVSMLKFFSLNENAAAKLQFKQEFIRSLDQKTYEENTVTIEAAFDNLWNVFVCKDRKLLTYFLISESFEENKVNHIFERLNTGGVPLTGADFLFTKIKTKESKFEDWLYIDSKKIYAHSGYSFGADKLLQFMNLVIKKTIRIDADKTKDSELEEFIKIKVNAIKAATDFFLLFLKDEFLIKNRNIIIRENALFPLISYIYSLQLKKVAYKKISKDNLLKMKQFFILSQINDWNTQTIINEAAKLTQENDNFPLDEIIKYIKTKSRTENLTSNDFKNYRTFTLKVAMPQTEIITAEENKGRYNPELDHIFPKNPETPPANYDQAIIDTVWNMQPVTGVINNDKLNQMPKAFFAQYPQHFAKYKFMPRTATDILLEESNWKKFVDNRKDEMLSYLRSEYQLTIQN